MFKVIDIFSGKVVCEGTDKTDILMGRNNVVTGRPTLFVKCDWKHRFNPAKGKVEPCQTYKMDFSELNVSGRDIKPCSRWTFRWNGAQYAAFQISNGPTELRRYQVLGENGRSIDIRMWMPEIKVITSRERFGYDCMDGNAIPCHLEPGYRKEPCGEGAKRVMHRAGCSSMWKQNIIDGCRYKSQDDPEDDYIPILDHTKARKRVDPTNGNTDNVYRFGGDRCWKNQRGAKQWGKHTKVSRKELAMIRTFKRGNDGIDEGLIAEKLCINF